MSGCGCGSGYHDGYHDGCCGSCQPKNKCCFGSEFKSVEQVGTLTVTTLFPTFTFLTTPVTHALVAGRRYQIQWSSTIGQSVAGSSVTAELLISGAGSLTIGGLNIGVGAGPIATSFGGTYIYTAPVSGVFNFNIGISIPTPAGVGPSAFIQNASISMFRLD